MFYQKPKRIFGPIGPPIQRGEGFGSLFSTISNLAKKVLPSVSKIAKKVWKSDIVQKGSKELLNHGMDVATAVASDLIEGKDVSETAKAGLQEARQKIAQTIRSTRESKPLSKRKLTPLKAKSTPKKKKTSSERARKPKKNKKYYSVFDDEDAK